MDKEKYKRRIADRLLQEQLEAAGMVLIQGPKWCGKTTTAKQFAKSFIEMQDPDKRDMYIQTAKVKPSNLSRTSKCVTAFFEFLSVTACFCKVKI